MIDILKNNICRVLANPIYVCGAIFLAGGGALVFALSMQHFAGLQPCPLCIWQRWPFGIVMALGLAGLVAARNPDHLKITAFAVFLAGLTFIAGGAVAFYHNGVEQHWWRSFLEGCAVVLPDDPVAMINALKSTPAARCDEVPWSFLGLSMAAWNAMASPVLAALCMTSAILLARRANNFP